MKAGSENIDDIEGVVYARDLLPYLGLTQAVTSTRVADIMTPAQYVPETLSVLSLLRDKHVEPWM